MCNDFTIQKVYFSNDGTQPYFMGKVYFYHYDNVSKDWSVNGKPFGNRFLEPERPANHSRALSLKLGYHCRVIVRKMV